MTPRLFNPRRSAGRQDFKPYYSSTMWIALLCLLLASASQVTANVSCDCLDICLMIDTSVSINDYEWTQMELFLCDFVNTFTGSAFDIRFAAVNFSKKANLVFNLNTYSDLADVKTGLASIIPQRKVTRHNRALEICRDQVFIGASSGDRDDATCPDVGIMITDGYNNTGGDAVAVATDLKNNGVTIVSVGIGNNQVITLLNDISSLDQFSNPRVLQVPAFDDLNALVIELFTEICPADCTTTTTPKPTIPGDPAWQTCCCGNLFGDSYNPRPDNLNACCGNVAYDLSTDTCCDGVLNNVPEGTSLCCGDVAFNPSSYRCCANAVVPAGPKDTACCFNEAFDPDTEICCGPGETSQVFSLPDPTSNTVVQCCGSTLITTNNQTCCGELIQPGNQCETRCCNQVVFDSFQKDCCDLATSNVQPSISGQAGSTEIFYCGGVQYEPAWYTCCCGSLTYVPTTSTTGCCLQVPYDRDYQICCNGVIQEGDPYYYECCGVTAFTPVDQTCCWGVVFNGLGACCGTAGIITDPDTQICCSDTLIFNVGSDAADYSCCTNPYEVITPFNVVSQQCCEGSVVVGGLFFRCCGPLSYDTKWKNCCNGVVTERSVFKNTYWCD